MGVVGAKTSKFCGSVYDGDSYLYDIVERVSNIIYPRDWIKAMEQSLSKHKFIRDWGGISISQIHME